MDGPSGAEAGGIGGLVALLREHGAAVEADLARFYGLDLSDLTTGKLTWRRLGVLIAGLPPGSSLARSVHGEAGEWTTADHLLAIAVDALQVANWQRSKDGTTGRNRPTPIPRPGLRELGRLTRSPEEVKAYLARFRPAVEEVPDGV